jgi:hypothetical protein
MKSTSHSSRIRVNQSQLPYNHEKDMASFVETSQQKTRNHVQKEWEVYLEGCAHSRYSFHLILLFPLLVHSFFSPSVYVLVVTYLYPLL